MSACLVALSACLLAALAWHIGSLGARISVHDDHPLRQQALNQQAPVVLFESSDGISAHKSEYTLIACVCICVMCCVMCCHVFLLCHGVMCVLCCCHVSLSSCSVDVAMAFFSASPVSSHSTTSQIPFHRVLLRWGGEGRGRHFAVQAFF